MFYLSEIEDVDQLLQFVIVETWEKSWFVVSMFQQSPALNNKPLSHESKNIPALYFVYLLLNIIFFVGEPGQGLGAQEFTEGMLMYYCRKVVNPK